MFMEMAETASKRSTCFRLNVGAIIVRDNDLVSMGYNGAPSGELHCAGNACPLGTNGGCIRAVHAEVNAIDRALEKMSRLDDCDLYVTISPCGLCAELIRREGMGRVFYKFNYRNDTGLKILRLHDIEVFKVTPSGYVVRETDQRIMT